jgi:hypothetical protein
VHDVLIALAITLATMASAGTFGLFLIARTVWRANRLVPDHPTNAPISWLVSPREPARLHRRLRRAVQLGQGAVAPLRANPKNPKRRQKVQATGSPLVEVADDLVAHACQVDDRLPHMAPPWRRELAAEVADIEAAALRLCRVAANWQMEIRRAAELPGPSVGPLELRARLDAVEAALAELTPGR